MKKKVFLDKNKKSGNSLETGSTASSKGMPYFETFVCVVELDKTLELDYDTSRQIRP